MTKHPTLSIFFSSLKQRPWSFSLGILFNIFAALLEGSSFFFILLGMKAIAGEPPTYFPLLLQSPTFSFTACILLAVVAQLLRCVLHYVSKILIVIVGLETQVEIQHKIFKQILSFSFPFFSLYKVGDLVEYAQIPEQTASHIIDAINTILANIFIVTILSTFLFYLSLPLTLIVIALSIGIILLQKRVISRLSKNSEAKTQSVVALSMQTVKCIYGIKDILTFNRQKQITTKVHAILRMIKQQAIKVEYLSQSIAPLNEMLGVSVVGIITVIGAFVLSKQGALLLPSLITYMTVTYRMNNRSHQILVSVGRLAYFWGPLSRLKDILREDDKIYAPEASGQSVEFAHEIMFKDVSLSYQEDHKPALKNINLVIPKGKVIGIVGKSGAGKSSLIDLMIRLYEPTVGSIFIDGHPLADLDLEQWRACLGVVSQEPMIFNESIEENIRFGNDKVSFEHIIEATILAGADEFIRALPEQYATILGERGYKLSGGQRQRIALARALVANPELLILDEATSNLDSHSERLIQRSIHSLREQKTIILIAHRLSTLTNTDYIYMLDQGAIIEEGTHHELIERAGHYQSLWELQTQHAKKPALT